MLPRARSIFLLILSAAVALAGPEAVTPENAAEGVERAEAAEKPTKRAAAIDPRQELKRLSHDEFRQRKAAQTALLEWGAANLDQAIPFLYDVYKTTDDPEVRLRSRAVLKRLVIIKQPFDGEGYLGIKMEDAEIPGVEDEKVLAVRITEVRVGTAAELAKLEVDDLVVGVDHVRFGGLELPIVTFSTYIKSKKPGDEITLLVRRGEETLKLKASLRRRSPLLDRLSQWGTPRFELPDQSELDEADFKDWLHTQARAERQAGKGKKAPAPAP